MEQNLHTPEVYDFRQYDHLWQRVAPGLEPYPNSRQEETVPAVALGGQTSPQQAAQDSGIAQAGAAAALTPAEVRQESQLPGAEENPCCMGTAAADMLGVLTGFIEEELSDQRHFRAMSRQAPSWARQRLRDMAAEEWEHARRLMAAYYLITGTCYHPSISSERITVGQWCAALRERYHAAACNGLNYARATEGTTDLCLARLLEELSADEYRQADVLLSMLERSLRP